MQHQATDKKAKLKDLCQHYRKSNETLENKGSPNVRRAKGAALSAQELCLFHVPASISVPIACTSHLVSCSQIIVWSEDLVQSSRTFSPMMVSNQSRFILMIPPFAGFHIVYQASASENHTRHFFRLWRTYACACLSHAY